MSLSLSSVEDWQAVLHLVAERGWRCHYTEGATPKPVPAAGAVLSRPIDAESAQLRVWPAEDFLVIIRFDTTDAIDFDVDLRELQGQERLDVFCGFLTAIGRLLGKPVLMDAEGGDHSSPALGYTVEHDRVVQLASTPDP